MSIYSYFIKVKLYANHLWWLLGDGLHGNKLTSILAALAAFWGVGSAAGSFVLVIAFVKMKISNTPFVYKVITLPVPHAGFQGVLVYGGGALILGLLSATCIYLSKCINLNVTRKYHSRLITDSIVRVSRPSSKVVLEGLPYLASKHKSHHIVVVYTRYVAFAFRSILDMSLPGTFLLVSVLVLFLLEPFVTLIIIPLFLGYCIPSYLINRDTARAQKKYLESMPEFNLWVNDYFSNINKTDNEYIGQNFSNKYSGLPSDTALASLYRRIVSNFRAEYLSKCFFVISLTVLFVLLGWQALDGTKDWIHIVTYFVALRVAGSSLSQLSIRFVTVSKFFPAIDFFIKLRRKTEKSFAKEKVGGKFTGEMLSLSDPGGTVSGGSGQVSIIEIQLGKPLCALVNDASNPFLYDELSSAVLKGLPSRYSKSLRVATHCDPAPFLYLSVLENIGGDQSTSKEAERIRSILEELNVLSELEALPDGLNTVLTKEVVEGLSVEARFAISSLYLTSNEFSLVFLSFDALKKCKESFSQRFIALLMGMFIVLVTDNFEDIDSSSFVELKEGFAFDGERLILCDNFRLENFREKVMFISNVNNKTKKSDKLNVVDDSLIDDDL